MLDSATLSYLEASKNAKLPWDTVASAMRAKGWNDVQLEEVRQSYAQNPVIPGKTPTELAINESPKKEEIQPQEKVLPESKNGIGNGAHSKRKFILITAVILGLGLLLTASVNVLAYFISGGKIAISNQSISQAADAIVMFNPLYSQNTQGSHV